MAVREREVAPYAKLYPLLLGEVHEIMADGLLSIATRGTVLGYHRAEMEKLGLWEKHLNELRDSVRS